MSTNRSCEFFEFEPHVWFYLLEYDGFEDAWDWRENAGCYGPFGGLDEARIHLRENHANPGGSMVARYEPAYSADETLKALVGRAIDPPGFRSF
jgi:hypothetical protein